LLKNKVPREEFNFRILDINRCFDNLAFGHGEPTIRYGSGHFFVAHFGSATSGSGIYFPLKIQIFQFFHFGSKNLNVLGQKISGSKPGQPLFYCGSKKVCLGQGPSLPAIIDDR